MNMYKTVVFLSFLTMSLWGNAQVYKFPLHISSNHRYMIDSNGKPFLYVSDSGWLLLFGLNIDETREYFLLRKKQGFTAIHIMLTAVPGPKSVNRKGDQPFVDNDFSKRNETFFDYAEKIIILADSCNMLLCIAPLWNGCCPGGWGTNPENFIERAGVGKCKDLGRYLGRRFSSYNNVFWIMGGDNDPGVNRAEINALAEGIKYSAPQQLMTYHASSTHSSTDVWDNEPWLDISMTYTYFRGFHKAWTYMQPDVYEVNYTEFRKPVIKPFLLGESTYENEHTDVTQTELQVRKQAYYSMLSGGCGHSYGSPFYSVGGRDVNDSNWKKVVDLPGANSLIYLNQLFSTFHWETLIPDIEGCFISEGNNRYATNDYAVTAVTADKEIALIYIPSYREIRLNFKSMRGKEIVASWYNPRNGLSKTVGNFLATDSPVLTTPDKKDWVLMLKTRKYK